MVVAGGTGNTIGGATLAARNLIAGNSGAGVHLAGGGGSICQGNLIGVAADGTSLLANVGDGVRAAESGSAIGGVNAGEGNVIAHNGGAGVSIETGFAGDAVRGNSLYGNGAGITLTGTANTAIAAPTLRLVTAGAGQSLVVWSWTGSQTGPYRIEFFTNPAGAAQGRTLVAAQAPAALSGLQTTSLPVSLGATDQLTATITDGAGNTSAFSAGLRLADRILITQQPADGQAGVNLPAVRAAVCDAGGTPVSGALVDLSLALLANPSGGSLSGTLTRTTVGGVATFADLQLDKVGTGYTLRVTASPLTGADTGALAVTPGPASGAHSTAVVPGGTAGTTTAIALQARDACGNPRATGGDTVAATVTGANAGKPINVVDHGDGTYALSYTPTLVGTDTIALALGGAAVVGSPFTSVVAVGAVSAAHSTAAVPGGTAGSVTTITVQVRDVCDNARTSGGDSVAATVTGANAGKPVAVADKANGSSR